MFGDKKKGEEQVSGRTLDEIYQLLIEVRRAQGQLLDAASQLKAIHHLEWKHGDRFHRGILEDAGWLQVKINQKMGVGTLKGEAEKLVEGILNEDWKYNMERYLYRGPIQDDIEKQANRKFDSMNLVTGEDPLMATPHMQSAMAMTDAYGDGEVAPRDEAKEENAGLPGLDSSDGLLSSGLGSGSGSGGGSSGNTGGTETETLAANQRRSDYDGRIITLPNETDFEWSYDDYGKC